MVAEMEKASMTYPLFLEFGMSLLSESPAVKEAELIFHAQTGSKAAFNDLVCLYHQRVIHVVYRMCGDAPLAEDAAQVAFLNAWRRLPQFRMNMPGQPETSFRNWLFRIAINAALDILRRQKPQVDLENVSLADPGDGIERSLELQERTRRVRQAVMALPEASRAVLVLREYEGLSYREIAETLDIPVGTVMSRLSYARSLLAQSLRDYLEEI
jgi:RNA polymerase sigma-70 factor (ECF subfamily)